MFKKKVLAGYKSKKRYLHNTAWIMGDKVISMLVGFLLTVAIARYLGPGSYGTLAYALSLVALFGAVGQMGLAGLVVREIVAKPESRRETMGTTFGLKLIGGVIAYSILLVYSATFDGLDSIEFKMIAIVGVSLILKCTDVIDFWFQAFVQSKYVSISRIIGLASGALFQLTMIVFGAGIIFFSWANLLQATITAILLIAIFRIFSNANIMSWKFATSHAKQLLGQGALVYLGTIFSMIYIKIDQVMLKHLVGAASVGTYAVAAQLSEAWYFIPNAIVASLFPKLIALRKSNEAEFNRRFQQLLDGLFILALVVAIATTFLSGPIVNLFFGEKYEESAAIFKIHIWAAIFIFMRAAFSRWILIEDVLVFSLLTQAAGALCNVVLNLYMIPRYGGEGAAYATLISYAMASFGALAFYKRTRVVFWMMLYSMICPIRYLSSIGGRQKFT